MATRRPSPNMMQMQQQHAPPPRHVPPPQAVAQGSQYVSPARHLAAQNEVVWMHIGSLAELLGEPNEAMSAYENALRHNAQSIPAMSAISLILRHKEEYHKAVEYLNAILTVDKNNGEVWGSLGHCYLMMDELQKAYSAYQSALVNLGDIKEPKLWYGIGILYDRYGSLEHAEEAFSQVMQMQPDFEKANEIYFRLGIIYKQQQKYPQSLDCFKYIVHTPPHPLTEEDIWFQIGHVHEQNKDYDGAKAAYQRVLERDPNHAKVLQQLGWLHHQASTSSQSQERAIEYLEKSVSADQQDAQSWYLLGRCYMAQQKYPKAYEAYQQAVYRDGRNPTFWCSIGVLYYQINQYRDALDAYSRAIRLNPYISEVWYDLGTLYESCNNQINDALDAYQRAAELDPNNTHIKTRLALLRSGGANGAGQAAPQPADVHPQAYQAAGSVGPLPPQWQGSAPTQAPPPPPVGPSGWQSGLGDPNPPQPPNPFEQRPVEFRGGPAGSGPAPPMVRPPSPRQEQQQQLPPPYPEPIRTGPVPGPGPGPGSMRREPSPPPPPQHQQQHHYGQGPPPPTARPGPPLGRITNPNYNGPAVASGAAGAAPPNSLPHFRATNSPRPDGRSIHDNRMPSPKSAYPQQHPLPPVAYPHHPESQGTVPAMETGHPPPPPPPPQQGMPADHTRLDDRAGPKRLREWEEEPIAKKQASDENRARLEDSRHRRPSTPHEREPYRRDSADSRRFEEQRRLDDQRRADDLRRVEEQRHGSDAYHPSEAAHHPITHPMPPNHLPPMQQGPGGPPPGPMSNILHDAPSAGPGPVTGQGPSPVPPQKEFHSEERSTLEHAGPSRQTPAASNNEHERPARTVDVNDNYDDSSEDDKKAAVLANGSGPVSADKTATTPTSAGINKMVAKVEPA